MVSVHVLCHQPDSTRQPATLTIASQLRGGRTCSLLTAAGAPIQGRVHGPTRASPAQAGPQPRKPEHFKHALPNGYHTRPPRQSKTDPNAETIRRIPQSDRN